LALLLERPTAQAAKLAVLRYASWAVLELGSVPMDLEIPERRHGPQATAMDLPEPRLGGRRHGGAQQGSRLSELALIKQMDGVAQPMRTN
jgi:hypothetical protein